MSGTINGAIVREAQRPRPDSGNGLAAGRLYDVLVEHFRAEQAFKDVDNIEPGDDFVKRITAAVEFCDVLLALIGPQWLTISDENGHRRLDNPGNYAGLKLRRHSRGRFG